MKIDDLRALTTYHAQAAAAAVQMADGIGPCPVADQARARARQHSEWALMLDEMIPAMEELVRVMTH